jgi:hypothetical protein
MLQSMDMEEMLERVEDYIKEMKKFLKRVLKLVAMARKEKDMIKLMCVNEKLTNIKGLLRIAEQSEVSIREAIVRKDRKAAEHEFTKAYTAYEVTKSLWAEAEGCVGKEAVYIGKTKTEVEVSREIPPEDVTELPIEPLKVERPPAASPFQ